MIVSMIRLNNSIQSDDLGHEILHFTWFQVLTIGWESGARTRVRNFPNATRVAEYLNKLHIGRYLSDDDYSLAWDKLERIMLECIPLQTTPPQEV